MNLEKNGIFYWCLQLLDLWLCSSHNNIQMTELCTIAVHWTCRMWLLLLQFPHFSEKGKCFGKLTPCFVPEKKTLLLFTVCIFPSIKPTKPKYLALGNSYIPLTIHVFILLWVPREIQYSWIFVAGKLQQPRNENILFLSYILFPAELYQLRQNNTRIQHLKMLRDYFFKIILFLSDAN